MTTNKPMTGEQLDELMTVAVNMQRDSEANQDRPSALFAYAVQVAVLELRKVRDDAAALAAENTALKNAFGTGDAVLNFLTIALRHTTYDQIDLSDVTLAFQMSLPEIPATDAWRAEVRAQGAESAGEYLKRYAQGLHEEARMVLQDAGELCNGLAAQLRQGGAAQ